MVWCVALFCGEVWCVVLFCGEVKCGEVKCGVSLFCGEEHNFINLSSIIRNVNESR